MTTNASGWPPPRPTDRAPGGPSPWPTSPPLAPADTAAGGTADADRAARIADLQARRGGGTPPGSRPPGGGGGGSLPGDPAGNPGSGPRRNRAKRQHPARGARALALVASVAATGVVGTGLAYADHSTAGADTASGSTARSATASLPTPVPAATAATAGGTQVRTPSTATPSTATPSTAGRTVTPSTTGRAAAPATTAATAATAATTSASGSGGAARFADGVWTGPPVGTRWGDVQVAVTIRGGSIAGVEALSLPDEGKSVAINSRAAPRLEAEAVAAQSARLDIVSGATYTSRAYATSLQAALDQAAQGAGR